MPRIGRDWLRTGLSHDVLELLRAAGHARRPGCALLSMPCLCLRRDILGSAGCPRGLAMQRCIVTAISNIWVAQLFATSIVFFKTLQMDFTSRSFANRVDG